jgi:hypothetical protein
MSLASSNSLDSLRPRSRPREVLRWATMPGMAGLLLLGVWAHQSSYENPGVFDEYHARCRSAIEQLPTQVGHWMGREVPLPQPALDLLDPNAQRNIRFTDFSPMGLTGPDRRISVMIVQCKLARDMQGHYPPRCYPAQGARLLSDEPRNWTLRDAYGEMAISGVEYQFLEPDRGGRDLPAGLLAAEGYTLGRRRVVLNFLIVPGVGVVRDMKGVNDAAEDYQQRHRGAAQVQVVFDPSWSLPDRTERDDIAVELLSSALPALRVLADLPQPSPAPAGAVADDTPAREAVAAVMDEE